MNQVLFRRSGVLLQGRGMCFQERAGAESFARLNESFFCSQVRHTFVVQGAGRVPKIALPTLTIVAPSSIATSKSLLMPMDNS